MRARSVEIDRLVLEGLPLSRLKAEAFRTAFAEELARLLHAELPSGAPSRRPHVSIEIAGFDTIAEAPAGARVVARSVARALMGR